MHLHPLARSARVAIPVALVVSCAIGAHAVHASKRVGDAAPPHTSSIAPNGSSALRVAHLRARQAEADASYAIETTGVELRASNAATKTPVAFGGGGVHLAGDHGALDLKLRSIGCEGASELVSAVKPTIVKNRASFAHPLERGSVDEWYVNGPLGVEQGFTLTGGVACAAKNDLVIAMSAAGDVKPTLANDGSVAFVRPGGEVAYHYAELHTFDAAGRELPGHMEVGDGGVRLVVDARDAQYPLVVDPLLWTEQQFTFDPDGPASWIETFGIDGDTAVVENDLLSNDTLETKIYVYARAGTTWTQQALLFLENPDKRMFTGGVGISGDTVVVGGRDDIDSPQSHVAAFVFARSDARWSLQQVVATDALTPLDRPNDKATIVALDGDTMALGGFDENAYVYTRSGSTWSLQQKLHPSIPAPPDPAYPRFALHGDTLAFGYVFTCGVEVFARSGATWASQQVLPLVDAVHGECVYSMSAGDDTLLVGDPWFGSTPGDWGTGGVHVFVRSGSSWSLQQMLTPSDGAAMDEFGGAVSLSGDNAAVGAGLHGQRGAAYVFNRSATTWTERSELHGNETSTSWHFGESVAMSGATLMVGEDQGTSNYVHFYTPTSVCALEADGTACESGDACSPQGTCKAGICAVTLKDCGSSSSTSSSTTSTTGGGDVPIDDGAVPLAASAGCGCEAGGDVGGDLRYGAGLMVAVALGMARRRSRRAGR